MLSTYFTPEILRRLELLRIKSRRSFLGHKAGRHLSPQRGHGIEFAEHRNYVPGDNPRHIDWNLFGRTEKMYVKTFQEEQNISVLFYLDTSNSMRTDTTGRKWEYAKNILLSLAYMALMEKETVVVKTPGFAMPRSFFGGPAFRKIALFLSQISPHELSSNQKSILLQPQDIPLPGIAILISDFLMPLEEIAVMLNMYIAKNLEITALQVLGHQDLSPLASRSGAVVTDSETGEKRELTFSPHKYQEALDTHNEQLRELCAKRRVRFLSTTPDEEVVELVAGKLSQIGLVG